MKSTLRSFLNSSLFLSLKACQAAFSLAIIASLSGAAIETAIVANKAVIAQVMYFFIDPFGSVSNLRVSGPDWMVNAKGSEPDWHYRARHGTRPCRRGDRTGLALLLFGVAEEATLADKRCY